VLQSGAEIEEKAGWLAVTLIEGEPGDTPAARTPGIRALLTPLAQQRGLA
jgi:hypothetical protein